MTSDGFSTLPASTGATRSDGIARGRVGVIVAGAGSGRRLGGVDKAFLELCGGPMIAYSVSVFQRSPDVDAICLVLAEASVERGRRLVHERGWTKVCAVVCGGSERQDSVRAGLDALDRGGGCDWVLVHDAARPLIDQAMIADGLRAAARWGAAVAAIPVRDTLKRGAPRERGAAGPGGAPDVLVEATVDRHNLWMAQTPQVFRTSALRAAFDAAGAAAGTFTDDAALVEATGGTVAIFPGRAGNVKLTHAEDVPLAEALLTCLPKTRR
ncbi:MAG: 2-C-methyl-D-erythritol 4-phosphate cytidylyltransferase [Chloroflexi bacterium]|nr:2-C-methyl-D-erythritol 4-phosphate cytidylyltransferase [Chloroflexota bacterium]